MPSKLSEAHDLMKKDKHEDALKVLKEAYEEEVSWYGADHVYTMEVQFVMARALERLLKYEEALYHSRESHRKSVLIQGADHPKTLEIQSTVALILERQEKYDEALVLFQELYDKQIKYLGASHEQTLNTLNNMTCIQARQGEDVLAVYESLYQKMKEANPDSPNILLIQCNIASQLSKQGQRDEALEILKEVNVMNQNRPRHLDTLDCLEMTATVLSDQGKHDDALKMCEKVLQTKLEMFGPYHAHTVKTLTMLRTIENNLIHQKPFNERLVFFKGQYSKRMNVLGPTHPETLTSQDKTAEVLSDLGKYDEAFSIYNDIYDKHKRLCSDLSNTYIARLNIGFTLCQLGRFDEALSIYKDIAELQKKMEAEHPEVLETQIRIAHTLGYVGDYEEALGIFNEVKKTQERQFGLEHKLTLTTRCHIASIMRMRGKYDEALKIYLEVLDIRKKSNVCPDDVLITSILHDVAFVYSFQGKLTEAYNTFSFVHSIELLNKSKDHPLCIGLETEMATILFRQRKFRQALESFREIYEKQFSVFGKDHPNTLISQNRLQILLNIANLNT